LQKYKMNFDKNTGVIEMIMESLTPKDEGTFTFQLQDGKATNQSSLVLIGDGMSAPCWGEDLRVTWKCSSL
jgi:hypothetical protein